MPATAMAALAGGLFGPLGLVPAVEGPLGLVLAVLAALATAGLLWYVGKAIRRALRVHEGRARF